MAQADIDEVGQYDYVHLISGTTDKLLHWLSVKHATMIAISFLNAGQNM